MSKIVEAVVAFKHMPVLATIVAMSQFLVFAIVAKPVCDAKVGYMFECGPMLIFSNLLILLGFKVEKDEGGFFFLFLLIVLFIFQGLNVAKVCDAVICDFARSASKLVTDVPF